MAAELRNRRIAGYEYGGELGLDELQPRAPAPPPKWRRAVENTLWLSAAAFVLYYGDGHTDFVSVLVSNPRIMRYVFRRVCPVLELHRSAAPRHRSLCTFVRNE